MVEASSQSLTRSLPRSGFRLRVSVLGMRHLAVAMCTNPFSRVWRLAPEQCEYTRFGTRWPRKAWSRPLLLGPGSGQVSAMAKFTVPNTRHSRFRCAVGPNTSFNRTRYGKRRKPGLRHLVHHLSPGLRRSPSRAG